MSYAEQRSVKSISSVVMLTAAQHILIKLVSDRRERCDGTRKLQCMILIRCTHQRRRNNTRARFFAPICLSQHRSLRLAAAAAPRRPFATAFARALRNHLAYCCDAAAHCLRCAHRKHCHSACAIINSTFSRRPVPHRFASTGTSHIIAALPDNTDEHILKLTLASGMLVLCTCLAIATNFEIISVSKCKLAAQPTERIPRQLCRFAAGLLKAMQSRRVAALDNGSTFPIPAQPRHASLCHRLSAPSNTRLDLCGRNGHCIRLSSNRNR